MRTFNYDESVKNNHVDLGRRLVSRRLDCHLCYSKGEEKDYDLKYLEVGVWEKIMDKDGWMKLKNKDN